ILQFVHEMATALASKVEGTIESTLSVNLFVQCALAADQCRLDAIAYEFFTQAFVVYEDQLSQSSQQVAALELLLGALSQVRDIRQANYDTLATKLTQYVAKLVKKKEQSGMVATCAHLFWRKAEVTKQYVVGLIALVKEHLETMEPGQARADVETHYRNTLKYIEGVEF
ncbi:hypothetical protein DYB36_004140, partial [Aphanomyces astaci]